MEDDKIKVFGIWLANTRNNYHAELLSVCANDKHPIETVKRKYGQFEALDFCLKMLTELYETELSTFKTRYLDEKEPSEDEQNI